MRQSLHSQLLYKLQDLYITGKKKSIGSPPRLFWNSRRLTCALLSPIRGKNMAEQAVIATSLSCVSCKLFSVHAVGKRGSLVTSLTLAVRILETPRYAAEDIGLLGGTHAVKVRRLHSMRQPQLL